MDRSAVLSAIALAIGQHSTYGYNAVGGEWTWPSYMGCGHGRDRQKRQRNKLKRRAIRKARQLTRISR